MTTAAPHAEHVAFLFDGAPPGLVQVGSTAHREGDFRRVNLPREEAAPWLANEEAAGRSAYIVPGVFRDTHDRKATGLVAVTAVIADLDNLHADEARRTLAASPVLPQRVVQTSMRGWQPIYLLDEGGVADLEAARAAQRGLVDLVGGDAGALGIVQPFRVPGTRNMKPGSPERSSSNDPRRNLRPHVHRQTERRLACARVPKGAAMTVSEMKESLLASIELEADAQNSAALSALAESLSEIGSDDPSWGRLHQAWSSVPGENLDDLDDLMRAGEAQIEFLRTYGFLQQEDDPREFLESLAGEVERSARASAELRR